MWDPLAEVEPPGQMLRGYSCIVGGGPYSGTAEPGPGAAVAVAPAEAVTVADGVAVAEAAAVADAVAPVAVATGS